MRGQSKSQSALMPIHSASKSINPKRNNTSTLTMAAPRLLPNNEGTQGKTMYYRCTIIGAINNSSHASPLTCPVLCHDLLCVPKLGLIQPLCLAKIVSSPEHQKLQPPASAALAPVTQDLLNLVLDLTFSRDDWQSLPCGPTVPWPLVGSQERHVKHVVHLTVPLW